MESLYSYRGKVISGKKRGRNLGFPTANIRLHKKVPEGIYVSVVFIKNLKYMAATFIGSAKTFAESEYKSESYILDFNRDIYGEWMRVNLVKKLRRNIKFSTQEELIGQINKDVQMARDYFKECLI